MRSRTAVIVTLVLVACFAIAGATAAQSRLPKLPAAAVLPQTGDSPGKVTFNHDTHVDEAAPNCTSCHPKLFKILTPAAAQDGKPITHSSMEKGQSCGACHNGQKAFAMDDCTLCHRSE